jgi:hypothetical protein
LLTALQIAALTRWDFDEIAQHQRTQAALQYASVMPPPLYL